MSDATSILATLLEEPLMVVDVGARWGFAPLWERFGDRCLTVGFEPDPVECERLRQLNCDRRNATFVPLALGARAGLATLFMTKDPGGYSLFRPATDAVERHPGLSGGRLDGTSMIETTTLDAWCSAENVERVDVIKIDTQGSELDILEGASDILATVRAVEVEVEFNELYDDVPLFAEIDRFLRNRGFQLWKLRDLAHYAQAGAYVDWRVRESCHYDEYEAGFAAGAGQLFWANAFYLSTAVARPSAQSGWQSLVRDACVTSAHQFHDLASVALELAKEVAPEEMVPPLQEAASTELRRARRDRIRAEEATVLTGSITVSADDPAFEGGGWQEPQVHDFGRLRWTGPGRDAWVDVAVTVTPGTRVELLVAAAITPAIMDGLALEVNRVPVALRHSPHEHGFIVSGLVPSGYRSPRRFTRVMVRTPPTVPWNEVNPASTDDTELGVAVAWFRMTAPGPAGVDPSRAVPPSGHRPDG